MNHVYLPSPTYHQGVSVSSIHPVLYNVPPPQYDESPKKRKNICLALICLILVIIVVSVLLFLSSDKGEELIEGNVVSESDQPLIAEIKVSWYVCSYRSDETSSKTVSTESDGTFNTVLYFTNSANCQDVFRNSYVYFELSSPDHLFSPRTVSFKMSDYFNGKPLTLIVEYDSFPVSGHTLFNGNSVSADFDYKLDGTNDEKIHGSTDSEGRFSFNYRLAGFNQGFYIDFHFENSEFCLEGSKTVALADAEGLIISLESTGSPTLVSGTVIYEGSPVVATVVLHPSRALEPTTLTTGSDGKFSTEILACGSKIQFKVTSNSGEFDPSSIEKSLDDVTDLEINVYKYFTITGQITVNGALSNLLDVRLIDRNGQTFTKTPSSIGSFTFSDVIAGSVQIGSNPYWSSSHQTFTLTGDRTVSLSASFTVNVNIHATTSGSDVTAGESRLSCTGVATHLQDLDSNGKSQFTFSPSQNTVCRVTVVSPGYAYWMSPSFSLKEAVSFDAELQYAEALYFLHGTGQVYLGVGSSDWKDSSSLNPNSGTPTCRGGKLWINCQSSPFTTSDCQTHFDLLNFYMYPASTAALTQDSVTLEIGLSTVTCAEYELRQNNDQNRWHWYVSHGGPHTVAVTYSERGFRGEWNVVDTWTFRWHVYHSSYTFGC
ncbi:hypothetical protein GEMRC1_008332 [Eukaryota sp. GEM-RC1]